MLSRQNLTKYGSFCLDINGSLPSGFLYAPGFLVKSDPYGKWLCCQCYNLAAQVEVLVLGFKLNWVSIIRSHTVGPPYGRKLMYYTFYTVCCRHRFFYVQYTCINGINGIELCKSHTRNLFLRLLAAHHTINRYVKKIITKRSRRYKL